MSSFGNKQDLLEEAFLPYLSATDGFELTFVCHPSRAEATWPGLAVKPVGVGVINTIRPPFDLVTGNWRNIFALQHSKLLLLHYTSTEPG